MKKSQFKTVKNFKGKIALEELRRAHLIITILALTLAACITMSIIWPLEFDVVLGSIAVGLLLLVAIVSAGIALRITIK